IGEFMTSILWLQPPLHAFQTAEDALFIGHLAILFIAARRFAIWQERHHPALLMDHPGGWPGTQQLLAQTFAPLHMRATCRIGRFFVRKLKDNDSLGDTQIVAQQTRASLHLLSLLIIAL